MSSTSGSDCTVFPSSLRTQCAEPWWPSLPLPVSLVPLPSGLFWCLCFSQNLGLSFPFPCIVTLPVISQAPPSLSLGGAASSLPLSKPSLHSFYSWLDQTRSLSIPRKGLSDWSLIIHWSSVTDCRVGDLRPEESRWCGETLPTVYRPRPTTHSSNNFRNLIF